MSESDSGSETQNLQKQVLQTTADVRGLSSAVSTLSDDVRDVVRVVGTISQNISALEANKNTLPIVPLIAFASAFIALLAVGLSAITVIGALALSPIRTSVAGLEESRRNTIEVIIPELAGTMANLLARVDDNESELAIERQQTYERMRWEGGIEALTSAHAIALESRSSDQDGAQNARIDHIEMELKRRYDRVYGGEPAGTE